MVFQEVISLLEEIESDRTVPKNVRIAVEDARKILKDGKLAEDIRVNNTVSILDEVSGDPNIPIYTRTQIWTIVSLLEAKESPETVV